MEIRRKLFDKIDDKFFHFKMSSKKTEAWISSMMELFVKNCNVFATLIFINSKATLIQFEKFNILNGFA